MSTINKVMLVLVGVTVSAVVIMGLIQMVTQPIEPPADKQPAVDTWEPQYREVVGPKLNPIPFRGRFRKAYIKAAELGWLESDANPETAANGRWKYYDIDTGTSIYGVISEAVPTGSVSIHENRLILKNGQSRAALRDAVSLIAPIYDVPVSQVDHMIDALVTLGEKDDYPQQLQWGNDTCMLKVTSIIDREGIEIRVFFLPWSSVR